MQPLCQELLGAYLGSAWCCAQTKVDFWILWCALLVGMGFGFTMLNNMSQIVESLGGGARCSSSACLSVCFSRELADIVHFSKGVREAVAAIEGLSRGDDCRPLLLQGGKGRASMCCCSRR